MTEQWQELKETITKLRDNDAHQEICKFLVYYMDILEKQMQECGDVINRNEVIDTIFRECSGENLDIDFAKVLLLQRKIKALQPVQSKPKTGWIPVSERLPRESVTVIGITKFDDIYKTELYDDCGEKKWYADCYFDVPIVAWMPLPEPYNTESEDKEMIVKEVIEVDCRKCVNLGDDGCIPYGKDANVAVKKCASEEFSCYVTIDELKKIESEVKE